jgi:hypothetical protein
MSNDNLQISNEARDNSIDPLLNAAIKLKELNTKNEQKKYSLGDVMLLDKFENELYAKGYSREEIETLSPSFYSK